MFGAHAQLRHSNEPVRLFVGLLQLYLFHDARKGAFKGLSTFISGFHNIFVLHADIKRLFLGDRAQCTCTVDFNDCWILICKVKLDVLEFLGVSRWACAVEILV